jgi:hypothetical protein
LDALKKYHQESGDVIIKKSSSYLLFKRAWKQIKRTWKQKHSTFSLLYFFLYCFTVTNVLEM